MNVKEMIGQKTTWAVLATVVAAVGGIATGETSMATGLQTIGLALVGLFVRSGIKK